MAHIHDMIAYRIAWIFQEHFLFNVKPQVVSVLLDVSTKPVPALEVVTEGEVVAILPKVSRALKVLDKF